MARKIVRANARVNTGLNWFFKSVNPEALHNARIPKPEKTAKKKTPPSSTSPKRLARLERRRIQIAHLRK